jgi:hypothetical protein
VNIEKIREVLNEDPFRPFSIRLADGRDIPIHHPDFVALEPSGTELIAYLPDNSHKIVDFSLITSLDVMKPKRGPR